MSPIRPFPGLPPMRGGRPPFGMVGPYFGCPSPGPPNFPRFQPPNAAFPSPHNYNNYYVPNRPPRFPQRGRRGMPPNRHHNNNHFKKNNPRDLSQGDNGSNIHSASFHCEVCDRSFVTEQELKVHNDGHEKCQFEGCLYSASPNLVALHVKFQHKTGLFKQIQWNTDSEAIEKWRAERKRKYPTSENIEKKKAEQQEKKERGEVIETAKQFRKDDPRKKRKRPQKRSQKNFNKNLDNKKSPDTPEVEKQFISRIGSLANVEEEPIEAKGESDEEWKEMETSQHASTSLLGNALSMITAEYGSDSEPEGGDKKKRGSIPAKPTQPNMSDDEGPEEESSVAPAPLSPSLEEEPKSRKRPLRTNRVKRPPAPPPRKMRKPTLLQMLLKDEIRKERNYILQCIRYIRNTNYLKDLNAQPVD